MKPSELTSSIHALAHMGQPFFVWGDPGVGKSQIVAQVADKLFSSKTTKRSTYLLDLRAVLLDPVDLMGIPTEVGGQTVWAPPRLLPTKGKGLLFFDELNRAPLMVQNACLQLVLDRKLGEYQLPYGWVVGAAGNYESETGVQRMPDALRSRFTHLVAETDLDDWCAYASSVDYNPAVVAFLRFRPELLHKYDRAVAKRENAFPCPRTWEFVSRIVNQQLSREVEFGLLKGTVGEAAATEFVSFLRLYRELPDMDDLMNNPTSATVPDNPSLKYAVANALAYKATPKSVRNILHYLGRFPEAEFSAMAVREMTSRNPALHSAPAVTKWKATNADVLL